MKHWENLSLENVYGEIWLPLVDYETEYLISNKGRIKRIDWRLSIIKQRLMRGYCNVCLCKNNIKKGYRVHRLESKTFIPNPNNLPFINHKNGLRDDNNLENLEWCDNSHNQKHSFEILGRIPHLALLGKTGALCKNSKPVLQYDLNGNFIKEWPAAAEAARGLDVWQASISLACNRRTEYYGFKWVYI